MPRIVTLTLNPAVDIACETERVRPTHKIRTKSEHVDPGGGGVNVARVVHELGGDVLALTLTGGVTGRFLDELLDGIGVPRHSIPIGGRTRISLNVHESTTSLEYRFVPEGPEVAEREWQAVLGWLETVEAEWVVASGSLPRGVPEDFYARAAAIASRRRQFFALDTSGSALRAALNHGLALVKPSLGEFEALVGRALPDGDSQASEAVALARSGAAEEVVVTLGRDGALLATAEEVIRLPGLPVAERSAAGAGDSFMAALIWAFSRGFGRREALSWGIAAGSAAVTSRGTAHVTRAEIAELRRRLGAAA